MKLMSKCECKVVKKFSRETKKLMHSLCLHTKPTNINATKQYMCFPPWITSPHTLIVLILPKLGPTYCKVGSKPRFVPRGLLTKVEPMAQIHVGVNNQFIFFLTFLSKAYNVSIYGHTHNFY